MARTPPTETIRALRARYTPRASAGLLRDALAHAEQLSDMPALERAAPRRVCAQAIALVTDLHRDAIALEEHLGPAGEPLEAGALEVVRKDLASLVAHGTLALCAHAEQHAYQPDLRTASFHVYATTQLELVSRLLAEGATQGYLSPAIRQITSALIECIANSEPDDDPLQFAESVAAWTGTALALYALAAND